MKRRILMITLGLSLGCRNTNEPISHTFGERCEEPGVTIYGCVDIEGRVRDSRGQPVAGADVGPALGTDLAGLGYDFVFTDSDGEYQLRLLKTEAAGPMTVSISMKAVSRMPSGAEIVSQTIVTQLEITPVGDTPDPIAVNFNLPAG
jgi:hypothetical protein